MLPRKWIVRLASAGVLAGAVGYASAQAPGAPGTAQVATAPRPAAVVNGETIPLADLDALVKGRGPTPVEIPANTLREMRMSALSMLIDDALLRQFLRKNCPPASPGEVAKRIAELGDALKKQGKTIPQQLQEDGITEAEFKAHISNMIQWRDFVVAKITDAQMQQYYNAYKDHFDGILVRASHIVIRVAPNAPDAEKQAAKAKLAKLRADLVAGKLDFATAARQNSQCPTAPNGGDLGTPFPRKSMIDETFARTAFALKQGEVSDIIQTEFGFHIITVTERTAGKPSTFDKAKEEVREMMAMELRAQILEEMRKNAKIDVMVP